MNQFIKNQPVVALLLLIAFAVLLFCFVMPALNYWHKLNTVQTSIQVMEDLSLSETILLRLMEFCTGLGVFAIGASIGSYLNVLVYRMPLGLSVFWKPSHCPQCGQAIAGSDNIPILGWMKLRGRCRSCQLPISAQYPIVEAIAGVIILVLFFWQTLSGGWNIPVRIPNSYHGFVWIIFYTKWDLIGLLLLHGFLFYTLLTWWLIEFHQERIPRYSFLSASIFVLLTLSIWPKLSPVPSGFSQVIELSRTNPVTGFVSGLLGLCCGGILGWGIQWNNRMQDKTSNPSLSTHYFTALTGAVLGWQAILVIVLCWIPLGLISNLFQSEDRRRIPPHTIFLILVSLHHLFWRLIYEQIYFKFTV